MFTVDDVRRDLGPARHARRRINLVIAELARASSRSRRRGPAPRDDAFPFVLSAGERRSSTANTIFRDPAWRKKDADGALRMHPGRRRRASASPTATACGSTTKRGARSRRPSRSPTRCSAGHVSLPNGLGLDYPDDDGDRRRHGVAPNELTSTDDRDWLAGTPWHKHVRRGSRRRRGRWPDVRRTRFDDWPCPIARTTDLIGDWWTPLVLRDAFAGRDAASTTSRRRSASRARCSPQRLDRLVEEGMLIKVAYEERPPRYEYRLTDEGPRVLGRPRRDVALGLRLAVARGRAAARPSRRPRDRRRDPPGRRRRTHRHPARHPPHQDPPPLARFGVSHFIEASCTKRSGSLAVGGEVLEVLE